MKSRFLNYALAMVFLVLSIFVSAKEYHRIEKVKDQKQIEQSTTNVDIGVTRCAEFDAIKSSCYIGVRSTPVTRANI